MKMDRYQLPNMPSTPGDNWTRVKPDFKGTTASLAVMCILVFLLLLVGSVIGQLHAHRFAGYLKNSITIFVPALCFVIGSALSRVDAERLPLVGPAGMQIYDRLGQYRTLKWEEIIGASFAMTRGNYKLQVSYSPSEPPLTIPFDGVDRKDFLALVERYVGSAHPIVAALRRG